LTNGLRFYKFLIQVLYKPEFGRLKENHPKRRYSIMSISKTVLNRLETQGFVHVDQGELDELQNWLRSTYALCAIATGFATALASPIFMYVVAVIAFLGGIFPVHIFDVGYNVLVRPFTKTKPLPHNGAPKRAACLMGAVWLAATGWLFSGGNFMAGYVLGGAFTLVAVIAASTNFCIPSTMYCAIMGRPKRKIDDNP
jgi:hypothetical protein